MQSYTFLSLQAIVMAWYSAYRIYGNSYDKMFRLRLN